MVVNNKYFNSINKVTNNHTVPDTSRQSAVHGDFAKVLEKSVEKEQGIKLSKHAELRLQARNIRLSPAQMEKISEAVNKAERKGVKDSLVLSDGVALVVNVKSRTVITAVSSAELKENVFTNIDGAVIV